MWFNVLKLDFKNLENKIKLDKEADSINIQENKKCRDKIKKFDDNLYAEFGYDPWANTGFINDKIPEEVYCMMVETIDKFFKQEFRSEGIPNQTVNRAKTFFGQYPNNYLFYLISVIGDKASNPFIMHLDYPKILGELYNGKSFDMEFNRVLNSEKRSIEIYERVKSCWERA